MIGKFRESSERELCHDNLAQDLHDLMSDYDTERRIEVLVRTFLAPDILRDRTVLDVGCGFGPFSQALR